MENYSTNIDRRRINIFLIIASVIITSQFNKYIYPSLVLITNIFSKSHTELIETLAHFDVAVEPVSFFVTYSIFWLLFDRYLWKLKLFRYIHINKMPNLNGDWEGILTSTYKNNESECNTKRSIKMSINQRFSKMKVKCYFFNQDETVCTSTSESTLIGVFEMETSVVLKFAYESTSRQLGTQSKHYYGYNEFRCNLNDNTMSGFYFTGRDTGQYNGTIELKKLNKISVDV